MRSQLGEVAPLPGAAKPTGAAAPQAPAAEQAALISEVSSDAGAAEDGPAAVHTGDWGAEGAAAAGGGAAGLLAPEDSSGRGWVSADSSAFTVSAEPSTAGVAAPEDVLLSDLSRLAVGAGCDDGWAAASEASKGAAAPQLGRVHDSSLLDLEELD